MRLCLKLDENVEIEIGAGSQELKDTVTSSGKYEWHSSKGNNAVISNGVVGAEVEILDNVIIAVTSIGNRKNMVGVDNITCNNSIKLATEIITKLSEKLAVEKNRIKIRRVDTAELCFMYYISNYGEKNNVEITVKANKNGESIIDSIRTRG